MWEFETNRLLFQKIRKEHGTLMFQLNSDPEVMKYTGEKAFSSLNEANLFCKNYNPYTPTKMGRYACFQKHTQHFLGWCGLKLHNDGLVDLGYRFLRSQWRNGYATEASFFFINHGFEKLGLELIVGNVAKSNAASIRVLEKVGMTYWKEVGDDCGDDVTYRYKITKKEWKNLKSKGSLLS